MYVGGSRGYNTGAIQLQTGILDYVPTNNWSNDESTGSGSGVLDYMILNNMGVLPRCGKYSNRCD